MTRATVGRMKREQKIDLAIALLAFGTSVGVMYAHGFGEPSESTRDGDALGVALLALMNLPLVARRRHPLAVFGAAAAATVGIHAIGYPGELGLWPALAVYSLAAYAPDPRMARMWGLFAGGIFAVLGVIAVFADPDPGIVAGAVGWAGAWLGGDITRQRRERIAALEERAERAEREAERERRLAAAEERTRIARELHDSAGHAMNVILVQAGAARLLQDRDRRTSREALETIEDVARATLGEIDRLVHALREDGSGGDLAPLPGIADIDELAERHRASGLDVTVRREGAARRLDTGVDRAVYRIVQESLTNAARHGDGAAEVVLHFGDGALDVAVSNPVEGNAPAPGGGHGLAGMRERAALLGGELEAGRADGEFRVRAVLPYQAKQA
jgi:signal transduction histidine kinase